MPIRFSTEAANDDVLGEDPTPAAATESTRPAPDDRDAKNNGRSNEAKPGKDINAAGFVKDKDSTKP